MQISKNYTLQDFTKSNDATRLGIDNTPIQAHISNLILLSTNILEPLCAHYGFKIPLSSGYRSKVLNDVIGGVATSDHCKGMAVDIDMDLIQSTITNKDIFEYILTHLKYRQLINEFEASNNPSWVHVAYNINDNKQQALMSLKQGLKTIYLPYIKE